MSIKVLFEVNGGEEEAIRYRNPDGTLGGFVSKLAKIGKGTFIHPLAIVGPFAIIPPKSTIGELMHVGLVEFEQPT
ncbi:MAG: hypothetical protein AAF249_05590 [Pseudomonadota bacterium]